MNSTPLSAESGSGGALTSESIRNLQDSFDWNAADRARFNAVTNSDIDTLALNREIIRGGDGHFSHRIRSRGITNQKASGRCWMFAGFNVMRPRVIHELEVEDFEFSAAYLLFWDKMEKSNLYLEQVIELREVDRLDREWEIINESIVGDGGWWNYVTSLIGKYGTVPSDVMPETHSSENTRTMNTVLARLLRSRAVAILDASGKGATLEQLRERKEDAIAEVYRFLVLNLGEPPREFEWRFKRKKRKDGDEAGKEEPSLPGPADETLSERQTYTPKSFYDEFVGVDLSDYVALYHDPAQPTGRHYRFSRARNIVGEPDMNFVNIGIGELKGIAVKSILANEPPWFAVNMGVDQSKEHGLMEADLFDYETLFGLEMPFSKGDRSRFLAGASNHAMVLMGVDLAEGKPVKWLVENSWGDDKGNEGTWTLYDRWFDEHVYNLIVHRRHVGDEILEVFDEEAEALPAWYPGARGIESR